MKLYNILINQLKKEPNYVSDNGELKKWVVLNKAENSDPVLFELLLEDETLKEKFFSQIKGALVFNHKLFTQFLEQKNYLNDSYTQFKNKVGLTIDGKYLNQRNEVALVWPFKDCILEGGQSKEEDKREEVFFNEILAQDEITQLLEPKVLTNGKRIDNEGEKPLKLFNRNENGTITDNLIIKGNNLIALHTLKEEFAGKVKLIYIDPPYNTGSDSFRYNDNFSHSTWLTFMQNRLEIARSLLSEDGLIFVQCDDNEQAYLKVAMDEVFGRDNFTGCLIWKKSSGKNDSRFMAILTEYCISFRKSAKLTKFNYKPSLAEHKLKDDIGNFKIEKLDRGGLEYRKNNDFIIQAPDGTNIFPGNSEKAFYDRKNGNYNPRDWQWRLSENRFNTELSNGRIFFKKHGDYWSVYSKKYDFEDSFSPFQNFIDFTNNSEANKELIGLFGIKSFSFPKPEKLIQRILEMSTSENDIVLDFHLGSGTTASVAHKMKRQYIGIEQMDYIETVAVERIKKVIEGEQGGISKSVNWQGGGSFVYLELKKYNQYFMEQIEFAKDSEELLNIWEQMKSNSFLNYNVDIKKQDEHLEEFKNLSIVEQKQHLCELLDKNQLYVNLSSLNDADFSCAEEEKRITKDFYQIGK